LPKLSVTFTDGAVATLVLTVALWLSPPVTAIVVALSWTPVAVNVTGLPVRLPEVAVSVFAPALVPSVQLPTVATPLAFVVALPTVMEPPPEPAAKVTEVAETALPKLSVTFTEGAVETLVFTVALWPLPVLTAIELAAPAVPVAVNVTGDPASPDAVAVKLLAPVVVPSVHEPTVAIPPAFVVAPPPATEPPPEATAKVTDVPDTGLP
jgi:hypothetical protein